MSDLNRRDVLKAGVAATTLLGGTGIIPVRAAKRRPGPTTRKRSVDPGAALEAVHPGRVRRVRGQTRNFTETTASRFASMPKAGTTSARKPRWPPMSALARI